jgi:hypothetical protein
MSSRNNEAPTAPAEQAATGEGLQPSPVLYVSLTSQVMRTLALTLLISLGCVDLTAIEKAIVITAKPRFELRGHFMYLVIADSTQSLDIVWGMPPEIQFKRLPLDATRVYTFTVGQKAHRRFTIPELRKVESSGETIFDIEVCEVHKTKMELKELEIGYDLVAVLGVAPTRETREIERRLFPHHHDGLWGDCVVRVSRPMFEEVYFCADCKAAYEKWKSENKKTE